MKQKLIIIIPDPCNAGWQNMTPDEDGRYCSRCSKTVIDFTDWSDERLYRFFEGN